MPDMIMQGILTGVYDVPGLRPVFYGPYGFHKARVVNDASKFNLVSEVSLGVKKARWVMENTPDAEVTVDEAVSEGGSSGHHCGSVVLTFL
ncbi:hypothetical protein N7501_010938 [Penicillium viridicatum]|nr:hypothetical protein N7501_010938 [Penicillium viridicatum]